MIVAIYSVSHVRLFGAPTQSRHQCMRATWSVRAQSHDQRLSVTDHCLINMWSVHDEPCDQCPISHGRSRTWLSDFTFTFHFSLSCIGEGNGNPLQCSCMENLRDGGAWWAAVNGVTQSRTRLKRLSSSSNSSSEGICLHWIRICESGGQFRIWLQTASRQTPGSNFSTAKLCLAN